MTIVTLFMKNMRTQVFYIISISLFTLALAGCTEGEQEQKSRAAPEHGQGLRKLDAGTITNTSGGDFIRYGFYVMTGAPESSEEDFLVIMRNLNAKFIDLEILTKDNFKLQDANGKEAKLVLHSLPRSIAVGEATSLQISAIDFTNVSYPLVFTFKANVEIPISLRVTNIQRIGD